MKSLMFVFELIIEPGSVFFSLRRHEILRKVKV